MHLFNLQKIKILLFFRFSSLNGTFIADSIQKEGSISAKRTICRFGGAFQTWKVSHKGKTHMVIGLGIKAGEEGHSVWLTMVPLLINQMKECRSERTLRVFETRLEKYDFVIVDEMGYISFDKEGTELLFTHLSLRSGRKSTIITTNLSFERWGEIFQDPFMTAAMIDRLTHQAYLVNMNGNSYRLKETKTWLKQQQIE
ncbi:MAG: ATP-binding protein [Sporolactobacillus sp.]